jgi:hypothetical protein
MSKTAIFRAYNDKIFYLSGRSIGKRMPLDGMASATA